MKIGLCYGRQEVRGGGVTQHESGPNYQAVAGRSVYRPAGLIRLA